MALVRANRKWMLEFPDCVLYVSPTEAGLHRASSGQTSGGVLRREEELQLQLSVRGVSPPVTPPASDIMLRLSSAS